MRTGARHRWLAWLLPFIVLRAFVPAGFMLSLAGGELQMMLCSAAGSVGPRQTAAVTVDHSAHAQHAEHAAQDHSGHHEHQGSAHENSICPYAAGGSSNAPLALPFLASIAPVVSSSIDFPSDPELRSPPVLIDRIRGPPLA